MTQALQTAATKSIMWRAKHLLSSSKGDVLCQSGIVFDGRRYTGMLMSYCPQSVDNVIGGVVGYKTIVKLQMCLFYWCRYFHVL